MLFPSKNSLRAGCAAAGFLTLPLLAGCGAKTASVNGKVTFRDKPVTGGSVILYCRDNQMVRGIIDSEGNYTIPNVPEGRAIVTVKTHSPIPPGFSLRQKLPPVKNGPIDPSLQGPMSRSDKLVIPERYGLPEESGMTIDVARKNLVFNIDLTP